MKIVSLVVAVFAIFFVGAQNSYYFAEPLPSASNKVGNVSSRHFGAYSVNDGTITYQFDENGLALISTTVAGISRETVRESSKYNVRNGYIFGVEIGDSVPCVLSGEKYYFGVRNHDVFVGEGSKHILTKTRSSSVYVLNLFDDGKYVPQILEFNGDQLKISHFDYEGEEADEFSFIESQEAVVSGGLNLIVLKPNEDDFNQIRSQAFAESMFLQKVD